MTVSKRILKLRKERNLSQATLAELAGLKPPAISQYESGARSPNFESLVKLSNALGVPSDYLLMGEDAPLYEDVGDSLSRMIAHIASMMPFDKREMLLRLTKTQFQLAGSSETIRKRILEIEALFEDMRTGRVRVQDTVFPGVKIVIGNLVRPIRETAKHASFYLDSGEIKLGPYA